MEKKKRIKIFVLVLIGLLFINLIVVSIVFFGDKLKENNSSKDEKITLEEKYINAVDNYAFAVEKAIKDYRAKNNGNIPKWSAIEKNIKYTIPKISCDNYINYDGSIYLSNCVVENIDDETVIYKGKYKYGKKLQESDKNILGSKLYIYKEDYEDSYHYFGHKEIIKDRSLEAVYNCDSRDCKIYNSLNNELYIYDDGNYVFDIKSESRKKLNIDDVEYETIDFIKENNNDVYGLILQSFGKFAIYSLKEEKFITDFEYDFISENQKEILEKGYVTVCKENNLSILNKVNGKLIKKINERGNLFEYIKLDDKEYFILIDEKMLYDGTPYNVNVYDDKFDLVFNKENKFYTTYENNFIIYDENKYYLYDKDLKEIRQSKEYKDIYLVKKNYVAVLDNDNYLKLVDLNDKILTKFLKVEKNYIVHDFLSGWYEENKKEGIYIVVENTNIPYGTEGSGLEYYYIPDTKESGVIKTIGIGGYAKPVLYLYPLKKQKIKVTFERSNTLSTTYPKYNKYWEVTAYPDGSLYDKNNKYYYGLYWEEIGSTNVDFTSGFNVGKNDALEFLEKITNDIGLTRREANEFIMYWLPILEKNNHSLVYIELTDSREEFNKLNISPKPDSLLRIAIHVKKVNKPQKIKKEVINKFERKGFTVVEWGGVIH